MSVYWSHCCKYPHLLKQNLETLGRIAAHESRRWILSWLVGIPLFGCSQALPTGPVGDSKEADTEQELEHISKDSEEVFRCEVFRGEQFVHRFNFVNPISEPIELDHSTGIRKSCGCTSIDIDKYRLEGGELAVIELAVDTSEKLNEFQESVELSWKSEKGSAITRRCTIAGRVLSPFRVWPTSISFTSIEGDPKPQRLQLLGNGLDIDWATLTCSTGEAAIRCEIVQPEMSTAPPSVNVVLRSEFTDRAKTAHIRIEARGTNKSGAECLYVDHIPVVLPDSRRCRITPAVVVLKREDRDRVYSGVLFLYGKLATRDDVPHLRPPPQFVRFRADPARISRTLMRFDFTVEVDSTIDVTAAQPQTVSFDVDGETVTSSFLYPSPQATQSENRP